MKRKKCSGCTACYNACPKNAIEMVSDKEGFSYPKINKDKCINCGICKKVCPLNKSLIASKDFPIVYAAKHKDNKIVRNSSSGGMFTVISDFVLNQNGVVYGVLFTDEFEVVHGRAESRFERDKMIGSKYVQSNLKESFKEVKEDLLNKKLVLFTGTPCQIDGLRNYLNNKDYRNLLLCDIVCHGVSSPLFWKERVNHIEEKDNLKDYKFKSKENGWNIHTEKIIYKDGKHDYKSNLSMVQKELYFSHYINRPYCHECKYTNIKRVSDITIGDFWGIEKQDLEFDDNTGVNLVLINTKKGKKIFEAIKNEIIYKEKEVAYCMQSQLKCPNKPNPKRVQFWNEYYSKGYKYVIKKYTSYGIKNGIKRKIKNIVKNILQRNIVKKNTQK